jgi:hypothetical protein
MMIFPEVTEAKVVRVEPEDVIWLKTGRCLSEDHAKTLAEYAKRIWPDNRIVIGQDLNVAIVRPETSA